MEIEMLTKNLSPGRMNYPAISIRTKTNSFNKKMVELLGLKHGSRVILAKDKKNEQLFFGQLSLNDERGYVVTAKTNKNSKYDRKYLVVQQSFVKNFNIKAGIYKLGDPVEQDEIDWYPLTFISE